MGEITRLHEAEIVPFAPNDATDVSNELTNIVNNGVNDNFNRQGSATAYAGVEEISITENATRIDLTEDRLDDLDPASPDGRVSVNEDDIDTLEGRMDVVEGLLGMDAFEIDAATYTITTGSYNTLRVVYSGSCTITSGDADDFNVGEVFTITATDSTTRYVLLNMDSTFGDFSLGAIYISAYDSVKLTVASYDGGANNFWHVTITPVPVDTIVWVPAAGSTYNMGTNLYPERVKLIKANAGILQITIVMPALLYTHERGYTWNLDLRASGAAGDIYINEHAIDGSATILHINGEETWNGIIVAGTATDWYTSGTYGTV